MHLNHAPGLCAWLPFPPHLPAQAQRGQQQDHEDEEGVTLVHGGPVLSRPEGGEKAVNIVTPAARGVEQTHAPVQQRWGAQSVPCLATEAGGCCRGLGRTANRKLKAGECFFGNKQLQ